MDTLDYALVLRLMNLDCWFTLDCLVFNLLMKIRGEDEMKMTLN
jgi:hypothetical protein